MILRALESRADVYNPVHPRDGALRELFSGGVGSSAGVAVTMESAVTVSAVYAAARVLAETVGSVPLVLYTRSDREKQRDAKDPLYRLLHTRPNPEMTSAVFRETLVYNGALGGNALAEIERSAAGEPIALWPLLSDRTRRIVTPDGKAWYVTRLRDGTERALSREQVIHVPIASSIGLWGPSVVSLARDAIGSAIAAQDFSGRFFSNGLHMGGFFKSPKGLSVTAIDRWKEGIKQWQQGLTNAHRYMVLEEGMEWQQPGVSPEHAQLIETRKFQVRDVARWFRMPPHMIQDLDNATFTNIEHQSLEFVKYTMLPWFTKFEQEFSAQLLGGDEDRFFAFVIEGLLRGDSAGRATFYTQLLTNGVISPNEVRELEDRNPRPGGDRFMRPLNAVEIDEKGNAVPIPRDPAPPRTERVSAFRDLFDAAARRLVARERQDVLAQARRLLGHGHAEEFRAWLGEFSAQHREWIERELVPIFAGLAGITGADVVGAAEVCARSAVDASRALNSAAPSVEAIEERYAREGAAMAVPWFERACALAKGGE